MPRVAPGRLLALSRTEAPGLVRPGPFFSAFWEAQNSREFSNLVLCFLGGFLGSPGGFSVSARGSSCSRLGLGAAFLAREGLGKVEGPAPAEPSQGYVVYVAAEISVVYLVAYSGAEVFEAFISTISRMRSPCRISAVCTSMGSWSCCSPRCDEKTRARNMRKKHVQRKSGARRGQRKNPDK